MFSLRPVWGTKVEIIHLDSRCKIEVPTDIALGRPPGENKQQQYDQGKAGEASQEEPTMDKSRMVITMQHSKGVTYKLKAREVDKVEVLQHDIYEWCGVPLKK